jgi:hypothetical protein
LPPSKYHNIRIQQLGGNVNPDTSRTHVADAAASLCTNTFTSFSFLPCHYFAESLTNSPLSPVPLTTSPKASQIHLFLLCHSLLCRKQPHTKNGAHQPAARRAASGLVHTAWGGNTIRKWIPNNTLSSEARADHASGQGNDVRWYDDVRMLAAASDIVTVKGVPVAHFFSLAASLVSRFVLNHSAVAQS